MLEGRTDRHPIPVFPQSDPTASKGDLRHYLRRWEFYTTKNTSQEKVLRQRNYPNTTKTLGAVGTQEALLTTSTLDSDGEK